MNNDPTFSDRHGFTSTDAPITIRNEAPGWLRNLVIQLAYDAGFHPSDLRESLCAMLLESPDSSNWSEFPNIDGEVRGLLGNAEWNRVYDFIEVVYRKIEHPGGFSGFGMNANKLEVITKKLNDAFRQKGVGWQLIEGCIELRGEASFESNVRTAIDLTEQTGRIVASRELHEALHDLSKRPAPDITGAIQHAMAALECVAKDVTGDAKMTLGEWVKKNPASFPQPLGVAVEKLWGYASQYGRHVQEGNPADYDEAEMVVGLAGALSVYLLRKAPKGIS